MAQCLINYNFNLSQNFIANIETQETERWILKKTEKRNIKNIF